MADALDVAIPKRKIYPRTTTLCLILMIIKLDAGNGAIDMVDTAKVSQVIAKHQGKDIVILQKKRIEFLECDIEILLVDFPPKEFRKEALAGVYPPVKDSNLFKIWFKGVVTAEEVVHECWHLFMTMLAVMDDSEKYFVDLNEEIYAYSFHTLFGKILDAITSMKKYKELYDKQYKNKELAPLYN